MQSNKGHTIAKVRKVCHSILQRRETPVAFLFYDLKLLKDSSPLGCLLWLDTYMALKANRTRSEEAPMQGNQKQLFHCD